MILPWSNQLTERVKVCPLAALKMIVTIRLSIETLLLHFSS